MTATFKTGWMASILVIGLGLMMGCGGDDSAAEGIEGARPSAESDLEGGGSIVTNIVATTNSSGGVSYVTNLTYVPPTYSFLLPAPEQISPKNGEEFPLFPPATSRTVDFEWTDVPGAEKYDINWKEAGDAGYSSSGFYPTTPRRLTFSAGTYTWKIFVRVDGVAQQESPLRTFIVK